MTLEATDALPRTHWVTQMEQSNFIVSSSLIKSFSDMMNIFNFTEIPRGQMNNLDYHGERKKGN